jgi:Asp-tRNA(Asn)/Glu-tRNA(Gln) amidotransferase A subunit family amidase
MRLDEFAPARHLPQIIQYSSPWSLVGLPALSVPCGLTADGLPTGLQLVGSQSDESAILRLANQYQQTEPMPVPPLPAFGVS